MGEHLPYKQRVEGSSPLVSTIGKKAETVRSLFFCLIIGIHAAVDGMEAAFIVTERFFLHEVILDADPARGVIELFDHIVDGHFIALNLHLHVSVIKVSDPSGKIVFPGNHLRGEAETDALYLSFEENIIPFHIYMIHEKWYNFKEIIRRPLMIIFEIFKAIILGIVEGITEWLPISSTGHMVLVNEFIKLNVSDGFKDLFFTVIQLGAILAIVTISFDKLWPFDFSKTKYERLEVWLLWSKIIVGCIPAGIIGLLLNDLIPDHVLIIALMLIVYGVIYIYLENRQKKTFRVTSLEDLSYLDALKIGGFQCLAIIPGTSRSGSTILGGMLLGIDRVVSTEFSFYLAIPVMAGESLLKLLKYGSYYTGTEVVVLLVGVIVAFFTSLVACRFFLDYIKKHDFRVFGIYRIALGILVVLFFFLKK